jgi:Tat protein translocase TatB subunit
MRVTAFMQRVRHGLPQPAPSVSVEAMFGIGMPELAVILIVGLIVLGPKRLPEVARALGKGLAEFRRVTGEVNKELESARSMIEQEAREHDAQRRKTEKARAQATAAKAAAEKLAVASNTPEPAPAAPAGEPAPPVEPLGNVPAGSAATTASDPGADGPKA